MIVVVTGSRSFIECPFRAPVKELFLKTIRNLRPTQVFHGGAIGPDAWASGEFDDIQKVFRPEPTDNYMEAVDALFERNHEMLRTAVRQDQTILVSCWDGKSRGTKNAIDFAGLLDVPLVSVPVELIQRLWGAYK